MRKILKNAGIIAALVIMVGISSCEKLNEVLPSMTATVDSEKWTSLFRASVLFESNQMITVTGTPDYTENVDKAIILSIYGTEAGTYSLIPGTATVDCLVVYKKTADADNDDNYYASYEATVTISSIDKSKKQISGTFSAKLRNTALTPDEVIISNGVFKNLNYQVQP